MYTLISISEMVVRRAFSNWKLLISVVVGVILASAILSGTVIYFDALRELALRKTLGEHAAADLDILVQAQRSPVTPFEFEKTSTLIQRETEPNFNWLTTDQFLASKSPTFFLSRPTEVTIAGDDNARTYFAFAPRLDEHITVLDGGKKPRTGLVNMPGNPVMLEAMVPVEAASMFEVGVGDILIAIPPWEDMTDHVTVRISGLFRKNNPSSEFWHLEEAVLSAATGASFQTVPFHISKETFLNDLGNMFPKMDGTYAWLHLVDSQRINARNSASTLSAIDSVNRSLSALMGSFRQTTSLDTALVDYDRRLFFSQIPMFVVLIVIAMVILYYVAASSALIIEDRQGEIALLWSRGASSTQILAVFIIEGVMIATLAIVSGPLLAAMTISILGYTPAFSGLVQHGGTLNANVSAVAYLMSGIGGILSFLALILPAIRASRIGVTRYRQNSARPTAQPLVQRYYIDVLLLLVSIFLFRQLTEQGSLLAVSLFGDVTADQLLMALPGLTLIASAMVLLRLFPLAMFLISKLTDRIMPSGIVLAVRQMARSPTHYARLSLLLILTAGLGIFASSFGATLELSFKERVLISTGSDIRLDGVRPAGRGRSSMSFASYEEIPGVKRASPVLKLNGYDLSRASAKTYTMLAVDGESFSKVAWFRDDFADMPVETLLSSLQMSNAPRGLALQSDAMQLVVTAKPDRERPNLEVAARIEDGSGVFTTLRLGRLVSSDWMQLKKPLPVGERPLNLVSLMVRELSEGNMRSGSVIFDEISVVTRSGQIEVVESFDDVASWSVIKSNVDSESDALRPSEIAMNGNTSAAFFWSDGSALVGHGISHGGEWPPLPVLASRSFVRDSNHFLGEEFDVTVSGKRVPVRIAGILDMFPTMTLKDQQYLIGDLTSLIRYSNLGILHRNLQPNGVWISTDNIENELEQKQLLEALGHVAGFSVTSIGDRAEQIANNQVDPLVNAGWRALLFIAFTSVLTLSCLGFLIHAYVSFRNRELQFALLRTVGFSLRQLITMVWLEQTLVILTGMALGTWMGGRLGATIMPFLGHDDWGSEVIPPFVMRVDWETLLVTYGVMMLVFTVISLGLVWLVQRISLQRILRLGEM